jgi:hypothetical protein
MRCSEREFLPLRRLLAASLGQARIGADSPMAHRKSTACPRLIEVSSMRAEEFQIHGLAQQIAPQSMHSKFTELSYRNLRRDCVAY